MMSPVARRRLLAGAFVASGAVLGLIQALGLDTALVHYERYQALNGEDEQVTRWIADLKRRIGRQQRTANVTE